MANTCIPTRSCGDGTEDQFLDEVDAAGTSSNDGDNDGDDQWMQRAFELAEEALVAGEVPVGCVFVCPSGCILSVGRNDTNRTNDATRHAELVAVDKVVHHRAGSIELGSDIDGSKIDWSGVSCYVTVEPCVMCADALKQLRVGRIVFGCRNDRFGGLGSVLDVRCLPPVGWSVQVLQKQGKMAARAVNLLRTFYAQQNPNAPKPKQKGSRPLKLLDIECDTR